MRYTIYSTIIFLFLGLLATFLPNLIFQMYNQFWLRELIVNEESKWEVLQYIFLLYLVFFISAIILFFLDFIIATILVYVRRKLNFESYRLKKIKSIQRTFLILFTIGYIISFLDFVSKNNFREDGFFGFFIISIYIFHAAISRMFLRINFYCTKEASTGNYRRIKISDYKENFSNRES